MAVFTLKKIAKLAGSQQIFLRGVRCYDAGCVKDFCRGSHRYYAGYTTARVQEPEATYHIEVGFNREGEAEYYSCDCPHFHPREGACKHVVAVLTHQYYADMIAAMPVNQSTAPKSRTTDPSAQRLIDSYISREALRLTAASTPAASLASLRPILRFSAGSPILSFTIGITRQYILKNPLSFVHALSQGTTVEYGKQLRLLHHPDCFTPESRPLLQLLAEELRDGSDIGGLRTASGLAQGELRVSPSCFDRLYDCLQSTHALLRRPYGDVPLQTADGEPLLSLRIEQRPGGFRFFGEPIEAVQGHRGLYVLQGETLYRPKDEYCRRMGEWLQTACAAPTGLFVAQTALPAFCAGVLSAIEPYVSPEGDVAALEMYRPQKPTVAVYLDAPASDTVTAQVEYRYGETVLHPFAVEADPKTDVTRNPLAELQAETVLLRQLQPPLPDEERLTLCGDNDRLFAFLTEGLEAIRQVATVYATDAFDALIPRTLPRVSVGLALQNDLLELTVSLPAIDEAELAALLTDYREHRPYHRLQGGRFIQLTSDTLQNLAELAEGIGLTAEELRSGRVLLPKYRALYLEQLLRERPTVDFHRPEEIKALVKRCQQASNADYALPAGFCGTLRPYQEQGYRWLRTMEALGFGGILADEMGLGKTIQIIALLLSAAENGEKRPSLVVCPTSLALGWAQELARFAPSLSVLCVTGTADMRRELLTDANAYQVIITSYDMLKRDVEVYTGLQFRYHILDEAQYIKNSGTQNARSVKTIHAAQRFALTGTPMENRLSELWSIFDFLLPGMLFSYSRFRTVFEQPIIRQGDSRALEHLSRMTAPFILRRLKSQVLTELPEKTQRVLPAVMEQPQRQIYLHTLSQLRSQLEKSRGKSLAGQGRMHVLAMLTRLRQLCCDPRLCCEGYTGDSCKLEACMELLREAAGGGHKVLLFSQFTSMLALIQKRLEAERIPYYLLQGSTPGQKRTLLADAFNHDDTPVFLISLKAGGTGLNLVGADMVIHYDPWWNIAAQEQATDRAHRIGQKRPVEVVRLIAQDTIEERILHLQETKQQLADTLIGTAGPDITALSAEELLSLLQ